MYGWKQCGGGGGNPDKKIWVYNKATQFRGLITNYGNRALSANYTMEERTDLYDCGKSKFFVIDTGLRGSDSQNFYTDFNAPRVICKSNGQYVDGVATTGGCYLVGYFTKISKNNTNTPSDKGYDNMFPGNVISQSTAGQKQCADILNNLWLAPVPGYGIGRKGQYKQGNLWRAMPGVGDEETEIKGGVYPEISPDENSRTRFSGFEPFFYYCYLDVIKSNVDNYGPWENNRDLWTARLSFWSVDPTADYFVRGLNKWLLDIYGYPVEVAEDANYKYYAFGFSVLGA